MLEEEEEEEEEERKNEEEEEEGKGRRSSVPTIAAEGIGDPLGDEDADGGGHDVVDAVSELEDDDNERDCHP